MSMFSSLDALEAATDATSAPRAAVFQPKVKPRARKGGGGGDTRSAASKPPAAPAPAPVESASTAAVDPCPVITTAPDVRTAFERSLKASGLQNPPPTTAQSTVANKEGTGTEIFAVEEDATPITNGTDVVPLKSNVPTVQVASPEVSIAQSENDSADETTVGDERPPVAVRSNFPLPPSPPTTGAPSRKEDGGLTARSLGLLPEPGITATGTPVVSRDSVQVQNPKAVPNPTGSKDEGACSKILTAEDPRPPSKSADEERNSVVSGEGGELVGLEDDEAEPDLELLSTSKRGRKRVFSHSTSQSRMCRNEREDIAPKIDLSKTDLSNPGKLTMREIIRRAEAIERKKVRVDVTTKKSAENPGKQKETAIVEAPGVSMAPQVQVINGRIVINEQSLTIGAYETSRQNTDTYKRVEENASRLNYNSYSNRTPTERWKQEDTDVFYRALQQFGTDFELIQNLFPGRTRRQVKAKFKKEERNNPRRLQDALAHRPKDQLHYTDMITLLKADEPDPTADDPFSSIIAYTNQ